MQVDLDKIGNPEEELVLVKPPHKPVFSKEQTDRAKEVINLHNALSHPSNSNLMAALNSGAVIATHLTSMDVRNSSLIFGPCIHCIAGKKTKPTYNSSVATKPAEEVGSILHCDLYGFSTPTIGNNKVYILCLDEFSGYLTFKALQNKQTHSINDGFNEIISYYKSYQHTIKQVQADHESTLTSCATFLGHNGITLLQVPPYQHAQRIERYVRTIKDWARSVLASLPYELPENLHGELLLYVVTLMNDLPNSLHKTLSPRILVTGTKLDINLRPMIPFGTLAMFHIAGKQQEKTLPRSELGIILGPAPRTYNAVRAYTFHTKTVKKPPSF